jgi:hypothetical protein
MQVFELLGKTVKVDTRNIATGLKEIQPDIYIGGGMFHASLLQHTEKSIKERVNRPFDELERDAFKGRINQFISECMHDIHVQLMKD